MASKDLKPRMRYEDRAEQDIAEVPDDKNTFPGHLAD